MIPEKDTSLDVVLNHPSRQKWKFNFIQIAPNNLNTTLGELDNVDISSVSITESYYTDTRTQAKLVYYGEISNRQAWIKITATETTSGYTKTLGVFIPTKDDVVVEAGIKKTTLNLESVLYGIAQDVFETDWVCRNGSSVKTALGDIFVNKCNIIPYARYAHLMGNDDEFDSQIREGDDTYFSGDYTIDAKTSVLSGLYAIANTGNFRLGVTNTGIPFWTQYIAPSQRTSTFTIEINSPTSIVLDGITRSSNYLSTVSKVVVRANNGGLEDGIVITATAKYKSGRLSQASRGYYVAKYYDLESMSPFTADRAKQLASEYLDKAANQNIEWSLTTSFMPIHAGEVGTLTGLTEDANYSPTQKVFVKTKELELATMTQKLTLKLASSNDSETGE